MLDETTLTFEYDKNLANSINRRRLMFDSIVIVGLGIGAMAIYSALHFALVILLLLSLAIWSWNVIERFFRMRRNINTTCLKLYPKSLAFGELDNGVIEWSADYGELTLHRVRTKGGSVTSIGLKYRGFRALKLEYYLNMEELLDALKSRISQ